MLARSRGATRGRHTIEPAWLLCQVLLGVRPVSVQACGWLGRLRRGGSGGTLGGIRTYKDRPALARRAVERKAPMDETLPAAMIAQLEELGRALVARSRE